MVYLEYNVSKKETNKFEYAILGIDLLLKYFFIKKKQKKRKKSSKLKQSML